MKALLKCYLLATMRYKPTWFVLAVVCAATSALIVWFQASRIALSILILIDLALLAIWPLLLRNDPGFRRAFMSLATSVDQSTITDLYRAETLMREQGGPELAGEIRRMRSQYDQLSRLINRRLHTADFRYGVLAGVLDRTMLDVTAALQRVVVGKNDPAIATGAISERLALTNTVFAESIDLLDKTPLELDSGQHEQLRSTILDILQRRA